MLEVRDLAFTWPRATRPLLDNVSLRLGEGEILGLQGTSGIGKTTLARLIAGHLRPSRGAIELDGKAVPTQGLSPIQLVFQHAETAANPRWKVGRILREAWRPDADTLHRFGIRAEWLERYPHEVSGGELQRIAIVRALVPGLRVLIADEITASHDAISQALIWRTLIETARERRFGIVAISHNTALLNALGARIVVLHRSGAG